MRGPLGRSIHVLLPLSKVVKAVALRHWSFGRIALLTALWAVFVIVFSAWRTFMLVRGEAEHSGLVGVSIGADSLLKLAPWIAVPFALLFAAWLVQRRR
jgi:hypothetical protein